MLQRIIDGIKERTPPPRKPVRQPVYMKEVYVDLLLRHYRECGLPEPDWLDEIPDAPRAHQRSPPDPEPEVRFSDRVLVTLTPDERVGEVRVRTSAALVDLYTKYYAKSVQPSIEEVVRAYNDAGFSQKYLLKLLSQNDTRLERVKKVDLDKVFKPDSGSKTTAKRAKKKEVLVEEKHEVDDDVDEMIDEEELDDDPFDMEVDEDEDVIDMDEEDAYESE
jgi:hypothetical protein